MHWIFIAVGILALLMTLISVVSIGSDIQIIAAGVFAVGSLTCFGFATVIKLLKEGKEGCAKGVE